MIDSLGWTATILMILAAVDIAHKRVRGLYLMALGNMFWLAVGRLSAINSLVVVSIIMTVLDFYGIYKWKIPKKYHHYERPSKQLGPKLRPNDIPPEPVENHIAVQEFNAKLASDKAKRIRLNEFNHFHTFNPDNRQCECGMSDRDYVMSRRLGSCGWERPVCPMAAEREETFRRLCVAYDAYSPEQIRQVAKYTPTEALENWFHTAYHTPKIHGSLFRQTVGPKERHENS